MQVLGEAKREMKKNESGKKQGRGKEGKREKERGREGRREREEMEPEFSPVSVH